MVDPYRGPICGLFRVALVRPAEADGAGSGLSVHQLTPKAFVETWGQPTYIHEQFTHFFGMKDGRLIPQARMALGESPQGWETGLEAGVALFLGYADEGLYLVFLDGALVYHEAMTAEKVHAVGKSWKYESQFKTRLELLPAAN
ncbi:MAG: exported protein of unknown function [Nitrospira sp.]|nr:exported protein of unknown function [Nitrospira sp.]